MVIRGKWEGPFLKLPPWLGYGLFLKLQKNRACNIFAGKNGNSVINKSIPKRSVNLKLSFIHSFLKFTEVFTMLAKTGPIIW